MSAPGGPGAGRRGGSLARRVTAACLLVALLAVGVSSLVALRLAAQTAREVAAGVLAQQADVLAAQSAGATGPLRAVAGTRRVVEVLRGQGIAVVVAGPGGPVGADAVAVEAARRAGVGAGSGPVSAQVVVDGATVLVEARPARGGALALVRTADAVGGPEVRRTLGVALAAGVAAALVVGTVAGGLLARPLRRSAAAARTLRAGQRDVRVPVQGPAEVADVAGALNDLADALARSEGRQRAFLLSVSHELRTPLTAVRGFGESIADGVVTGAAAAAAGRTVVAEAQRLERLVDDLMALARLAADDFRIDLAEVDLGRLLDGAAAVWTARCAAVGVAFAVQRPPGPVVVRTDPRRLRQVVDGLAENALRVTPPGAPLRFALHRAPVRIEVRDGGPGLDPTDAADAFRPGVLHERHRGARPGGAAGIGLALAHGLVSRLGGTITVDRAPEGGARFTIGLPSRP